jgi:hypothetical protein
MMKLLLRRLLLCQGGHGRSCCYIQSERKERSTAKDLGDGDFEVIEFTKS